MTEKEYEKLYEVLMLVSKRCPDEFNLKTDYDSCPNCLQCWIDAIDDFRELERLKGDC